MRGAGARGVSGRGDGKVRAHWGGAQVRENTILTEFKHMMAGKFGDSAK